MNDNIKKICKQAGIDFGNFESVTVDCDQIEEFAKLIVREVFSKTVVDGEHFYHNQSNNYGTVSVRFWTGAGNPWDKFRGAEEQANFHNGRRGTGRYHLNDAFAKYVYTNTIE